MWTETCSTVVDVRSEKAHIDVMTVMMRRTTYESAWRFHRSSTVKCLVRSHVR